MDLLFYDGGPYYIETSPLICGTNQWTSFPMIGTTFMKELKGLKTTQQYLFSFQGSGKFGTCS